MTGPAPFDPLRLLETLSRDQVRFAVVGGIAGRLLGSPTVTRDLNIRHARDAANLRALAAVLAEIHAQLCGVDPGLPFRPYVRALRAGDAFTLKTDAGDLDLLGTPAGTDGYADLAVRPFPQTLAGAVLVADVNDLIRMKRAAGRPKDLIEVEVLGALRDEIEDLTDPHRRPLNMRGSRNSPIGSFWRAPFSTRMPRHQKDPSGEISCAGRISDARLEQL